MAAFRSRAASARTVSLSALSASLSAVLAEPRASLTDSRSDSVKRPRSSALQRAMAAFRSAVGWDSRLPAALSTLSFMDASAVLSWLSPISLSACSRMSSRVPFESAVQTRPPSRFALAAAMESDRSARAWRSSPLTAAVMASAFDRRCASPALSSVALRASASSSADFRACQEASV